jgi:alpha-glucoside transport system substrate-binding protein
MSRFSKLLTLVALLAMLLAACGGREATQPPATQPPATEAMTEAPTEAATEAPTEAATTAPATGEIDCAGAQSGDEISLIYQWSGQEEERFNQIVQPLVDACGITFKPESTRDQALLDTRVQAGTPPDIAFWNVTQLNQYQDKLFAMDELGASKDAYIPGAIDPGVVGDKWVGLPVKSDVKTIIWYSPANFESLGYTVPATWDELDALVEKMVADGQVPWSMGMESGDATGWTGSDFIQDILLVQQGPAYIKSLIDGSTPYDDAGVQQAYETYGKWAKDPKYSVGGAEGTLSTPFLQAIYKPFSDPPEAMMVKQSGFAGGEIKKQFPTLEYGKDYDFFVVPGAKGLQGGSDWMMAFSDKPAVKALVTYLASEQGGVNWAKAGFGLSPNKGAEGNFTEPDLMKLQDAFYKTEGFVPDLGDTIPGGFGSAEWKAIIDYINGGDVAAALAPAAAAQKEALSK